MTARSRRALERSLAPDESDPDAADDPVDLAKLEDAMRRVPRRQREIFLAVRVDDLRYAEIADRTGLTVAQIKRLFAKALFNLMRNLDHPRRRWWRRWLG